MNNVTPEHLVTVTQGATPLQIVILILLGALAIIGVVWLCKWLVELKMGTLPADISKINDSLTTLKADFSEMNGKLWSKDDVDTRIGNAIKDHIEQCPFHHEGR